MPRTVAAIFLFFFLILLGAEVYGQWQKRKERKQKEADERFLSRGGH